MVTIDSSRNKDHFHILHVYSRMQSWSRGVPPRVTLTHQTSSSTCAQNCLFAVLLLSSIFIITVIFMAAVVSVINNDCFMYQVKHDQVDGEFSTIVSVHSLNHQGVVMRLEYLSPLPLPPPPQLNGSGSTTDLPPMTVMTSSHNSELSLSPWTIGACVGTIFGAISSASAWARNC
jgi:hypothetical protein